jgi:Mor family transcriptional regulator
MAMKSKITRRQIRLLFKRYDKGEPLYKICAAIPVSIGYAKKLLRQAGVHIRGHAESKQRDSAQIQDMIRRYQGGESASSIATDFALSASGVIGILKRAGVSMRSSSEAKGGMPSSLHGEICRKYLEGIPVRQLQAGYKASEDQIYSILHRNNVRVSGKALLDEEQILDAIQRYKAGASAAAIAASFSVGKHVVLRALRKKGVKRRTSGEAQRMVIPEETIARWKKEYEAGSSIKKIAENESISSCAVSARLKRAGVYVKPTNRKLSPEDTDRLLQDYRSNIPLDDLSIKYGVSVATINNLRRERGIKSKKVHHFDLEFDLKIIREYESGKSSVEIGQTHHISSSSVGRILERHSKEMRSVKEASGGLTTQQEQDVCERYAKGEASLALAREYGVEPTTIPRILARRNTERRRPGAGSDSIYSALTNRHLYSDIKETSLYVYELKRFPKYLKVGISIEPEARAKNEEYGEFVQELRFSSRHEAFIMEQLVLGRFEHSCPEELVEVWAGWTEVRLASEDELNEAIDWALSEINKLGLWSAALLYVPMTAHEKSICQKKIDADAG